MTRAYSPFSDGAVRWSILACLIGFGGFLLWAAVAPLEEGVTASGQIVLRDDRKTIQHFEGGIIRRLYVSEGDRVEQGAVLLELEPLQSEAARDELAQQLLVQQATLARLQAVRDGDDAPDFSLLDADGVDGALRDDIVTRQRELFRQQTSAHEAELSVLRARREALTRRIADLGGELAATRSALEVAERDLRLREDMMGEGLETIGNVQTLQREVASYRGELSRLTGDQNAARASITETDGQIAELQARLARDIGTQMVEAQANAMAAAERLRGTEDRLARTVIRAPQAGQVFNLGFKTVGGVVRQGEPIMDIVPETDDLLVAVRLRPTDRDAVSPGQRVEAQLTAYKSFIVPRLPGEVMGVSADLKQDEASRSYYYEARILLDRTEGGQELAVLPGMPVEAFIASGRRRTMLDYLLEPILGTLRRGARMG